MLCNSWIIEHIESGQAILETWNPKLVAAVNTAKYRVWTAHAWLVELNRRIAANKDELR